MIKTKLMKVLSCLATCALVVLFCPVIDVSSPSHAFDILENEGYRNWAEIARTFRKEILNGVRYADTKLGRQRINVALKVFGLEVEDFREITSYTTAGQGHYFNPERFAPRIQRFSDGDEFGLKVSIKKFFGGVGHLANLIPMAVIGGTAMSLGGSRIIVDVVQLQFVLDPPDGEGKS